MTGVIAVHVGAGCHSSSLKCDYKKLMKKACKEAVIILRNGSSAVDAVCYATQILENSPLTNAGFGSSLTYDGTVECDASVMDGKSLLHGSVGAVSGIKNPVSLAREVMESQNYPLPGGLIPPSFLTGAGARSWAVTHDIELCQDQDLVSEKSKKIHGESLCYVKRLENRKEKRRKCFSEPEEQELQKGLLDTVGAVCVDLDGNVASVVSSGGLLLKQPGRVGQAAVYGSGCWSENNCEGSGNNVAVSTSGCGEHLIRTMFAHLCAKATVNTDPLGESLSKAVTAQFLESKFLSGIDSKMGGSVSLRFDPSSSTTDLYWMHTTPTMGVAYMSVSNSKAQAIFSELSPEKVGHVLSLNCKSFTTVTQTLKDKSDDEDDLNELSEEECPSSSGT